VCKCVCSKARNSPSTWSKLLLSPAAPERELREAKEDGIERKDGMYDVEHSSRRNNKSIINAD